MLIGFQLNTNGTFRKFHMSRDAFTISQAIDCDFIEIVRPVGYYPCVLVIDDSGRLKDKPVNKLASLIYGIKRHGEPIVGNALLLKEGMFNGEPDLMSLDVEDLLIWQMRLKELQKETLND